MHTDQDKLEVKIGPFTETRTNKLMGKSLGYNMKCENFSDHKTRKRKLISMPSQEIMCTPVSRHISRSLEKGSCRLLVLGRDLQNVLLHSQRSVAMYNFNVLCKSSVSCLPKIALVVLSANLDPSTRY